MAKKAKALPKRVHCSFCERDSAAVQVLVASQSGAHICERCTDVCKQIADSKVGGTSGLTVVRKMPVEVARETIALLRQMKDEQVLSADDYKRRCLQLIEDVVPTKPS
jgi:ATP-dependent protease Clp ATPase subunit